MKDRNVMFGVDCLQNVDAVCTQPKFNCINVYVQIGAGGR